MKRLMFGMCLLLSAALACEPEPRTIEPGASPTSSALAISEDDQHLLIAAEDHDQLIIMNRETQEVLHRVDVGDAPSHVIVGADGVAMVTTRYGHALTFVDVDNGTVLGSVQVGIEPIGLTLVDRTHVAVVIAGESALVIVNTETQAVEKTIALSASDPRAVAKVGDKLFVTHMTAGVVSEILLTDDSVHTTDISTEVEGPRLHANLTRSITVAPDDQMLMIAHSQANSDTMRAPINGDGFGAEEGSCGYGGCAAQLGANTPMVNSLDPRTATVVSPIAADIDEPSVGFFGECVGCGRRPPDPKTPPNLMAPFQMRFLDVPMNNPVAIAIADGGRGQLVLNQGTQNVVMLRRDVNGLANDVVGMVNVGHGANTIAMTHSGTHAYVWNQFDVSITEIELPMFDDRRSRTGGAFAAADETDQNNAEFEEVTEFAVDTFVVAEDALDANVSEGRKLFHSATDTRMSQDQTISCATCHPDGRTDNRTWQFTFGPRNTPQLGGGILETAPFHWPGDVEDIPDLNRMTVLAFMGGSGVEIGSMESIGAFIDTIRPAPTASALNPGLTPEQLRGQEIFYSDSVGCAQCHTGLHMTDNISYDVQTQANDRDISMFQTPVLHGLSRSGPYLHDGSAQSLLELLLEVVATNKMGTGSHLTDAELVDLAAFLETL